MDDDIQATKNCRPELIVRSSHAAAPSKLNISRYINSLGWPVILYTRAQCAFKNNVLIVKTYRAGRISPINTLTFCKLQTGKFRQGLNDRVAPPSFYQKTNHDWAFELQKSSRYNTCNFEC